MLVWPAVAVLGFVALIGMVIALGVSTTARYEFERNRVPGRRHQPAAAPATEVSRTGGGSTGRQARDDVRTPRGGARGERLEGLESRPGAVAVAAHPVGQPAAPVGHPAVDGAAVAGWWLVGEAGGLPGGQVVAGPFADRLEADWAALASGLPLRVRYAVRRAGGALATRPAPEELAWLAELGGQLDRLAEDWDALATDTDALTTLAVEVAAAVVEAGLPLHDCGRRDPAGAGSAGGVCLTPAPGHGGILVSWRQHDRMSLQQVRGAAADAAVQHTMNGAVAGVLAQLGFDIRSLPATGCHLVTVGGPVSG